MSLESWETLRDADPAQAARVLNQFRKKVFVPHEGGQADVMASDARFRVLRAGRRWGKTQLAAHEVLRAALSKPGQMVWWVANTDKNVRRGFRAVKSQTPRLLLSKEPPSDAANDRIMHFKNDSQIEFYTAGTPDSLAGEGVDFVVVDEAALIPESVWYQLIRPTLSDTGGRALLISTPRGRNWFHKAWYRGQDPSAKLWDSWHFPSIASPYMNEEDIAEARDSMPTILYEQEYRGEFVANAASIFLLTDESVRPWLVPPEGWVNIGVDLAKKEDFSVISGSNAETRLPCVYERFNDVSWPIQEEHIVQVVRDLEEDPAVEGVSIGVDSTGVGDVVFDHLEEQGLDVVPINFASANIKERMVRLLAADLENGQAFITEEQRDEHEHYEYEISPTTGRMKFAAPEGEHDDKVAAKMIEHWITVNEGPPGAEFFDPAEVLDEAYDEGVWDDVPEDTGEVEVTEAIPASPREIMARSGAWA
jgi:Terminase large subunit, T4likevirus-type, N-terminal